MSNLRSSSVASLVFDKLENEIIQGTYEKGDVLTEQKLAEKMGVSRPYVREALQRLAQEHLVADSGKGSVVLGVSKEDILDIMEIRERVEAIAAYYAACNATEAELEELSHIVNLQSFYYSQRDSARLKQTDEQFHNLVCNMSGRMVIIDILLPLLRKSRFYRQRSMGNWDRAVLAKQEHYNIYHAIAQGDADLASKLTALHLSNAKAHMIKTFQ